MRINIKQIPPEGLNIQEDIAASSMDLETDTVKFTTPLRVRASIFKITNAVSADLGLEASVKSICSRCLAEFRKDLKKELKLNYSVSGSDNSIDIGPDIREEIILDYPIKPLCRPDCKGLCRKCGKNLNEGGCSCATT